MNQKQSEDFDLTVRKLAEEAERAYQEHSWSLMERKLDYKKIKGD
jgi:predicted nucleotidyltransferase